MAEIITPAAPVQSAEKKFEVFFCHLPNSQFVFPNGAVAVFVGGRYVTDDIAKATYLQYEIDNGHPQIYRKADCMQLAEEDLAPDAEYRKKVIAEYLEEQKKIAAASANYGTSEAGKLNIADTSNTGVMAAESISPASSAPAVAPAVAVKLSK